MEEEVKKIKRRLRRCGMTPTTACQLANINYSTYYRWTKGATPSEVSIETINMVLDIYESQFLSRLMVRAKLWRNTVIKPEERICIDIADMLRQSSESGDLRCVWHRNFNEGKRSRKLVALFKCAGLIPGVADFSFKWDCGAGAIEIKAGKNQPQPNQYDYRDWCESKGVNHAFCWSLEEVMENLIEWGVLHVR